VSVLSTASVDSDGGTGTATAASDPGPDFAFAVDRIEECGLVWEGRERVGSLGAGESYTSTERVDLSLADAVAVEGAGGWITVRTTMQSAEEPVTVTVTQRRQVA